MRHLLRKVAFVGTPDASVAEALREHGYRIEAVATESVVGLARALHGLRPAAVHAREAHFKAALVARMLDVLLLVHVSRAQPGTLTATASGSSQINLAWGPATDDVGVTNYLVERCQGALCSSFAQVATTKCRIAEQAQNVPYTGCIF